MTPKPPATLFVCTMNVVRSPMAAALLRHLAGADVHVASAGVRVGLPDAMAAQVMAEIGLDMGGHIPRALEDVAKEQFALVIALTGAAHERARAWAAGTALAVEYWPVMDPTLAEGARAQRLEAYRALRDQLAAGLKARFFAPGSGGAGA